MPVQERSAISDKRVLSPQDEVELDATIHKIAKSHGYISNLMQTLALAPQGLAAFAALSTYTHYHSQLTGLQRQLAIIVAVRDVHYAWTHHEPLARAAGVTSEQILLIRDGRVPKDLAPAEQALCAYVFEISCGRSVSQWAAEAMHENFSARQIVDIALLTAFSVAVGALSMGLELSVETPETLQFELEWHQQKNRWLELEQ